MADWASAFSNVGNSLYSGGTKFLDFMGTDAAKNIIGLGGLGTSIYGAINQNKAIENANKLATKAYDYNLQKDKDMQNAANTAYMNSNYAKGL